MEEIITPIIIFILYYYINMNQWYDFLEKVFITTYNKNNKFSTPNIESYWLITGIKIINETNIVYFINWHRYNNDNILNIKEFKKYTANNKKNYSTLIKWWYK